MAFVHARRAFTLIELLVVIGIISILIAVSVVVGKRVAGTGKAMVTADTIRVLDAAVGEYVNRIGRLPALAERVETTAGPALNVFPVIDGVDTVSGKLINSIGLFIHQAEETGGVGSAIAQIDEKFVRLMDVDGPGPQPGLTTVVDGWDRPIRYVHPAFDGTWTNEDPRPTGQAGSPVDLSAPGSPIKDQTLRNDLAITMVRRNFLTDKDRETSPTLVGDSDGGICPTPNPYFYSAGEDGDPSTLDDNVYTTKPRTAVQ
ncbi:MAG: hypothetical protein Kow0022_12880 [Phycisphaerales bacterium]